MVQDKITELAEKLCSILTCAEGHDELIEVIKCLMTPGEIEGILQRWELLKLLKQGVPQREIVSRLKICLGKVSRGARLLKYDSPEFQGLLERISEKMEGGAAK